MVKHKWRAENLESCRASSLGTRPTISPFVNTTANWSCSFSTSRRKFSFSPITGILFVNVVATHELRCLDKMIWLWGWFHGRRRLARRRSSHFTTSLDTKLHIASVMRLQVWPRLTSISPLFSYLLTRLFGLARIYTVIVIIILSQSAGDYIALVYNWTSPRP